MESQKESGGRQLCIEEPYIQDELFDCGWAVVANLLLMINADTNELLEDVRERLEMTFENGTTIRKLTEVLDYLGMKYDELKGATIEDLEKEIDSLRPCIVVYQAWGSKPEKQGKQVGHYSLVVGYSDKYLWVVDPSEWYESHYMVDGYRRIDKKVFDRWWVDLSEKGEVIDHWCLAITLD